MGVTELIFELQELKTTIMGVFSRSYCYYGNQLFKKMMTATCLPMIPGHLYDIIIVVSLVKQW